MNAPRLIIQPDHGLEPVIGFLRSASKEILIKQFTFDHPALLDEVLAQHRRGLHVRVLLNGAKATGERINDSTFETMGKAGISVKWSCPDFLVTHEKTVVVDGKFALIATFNFMAKYFSQTRDYGIILSDPSQVKQITTCFDCDWQREPFHPDRNTDLA